jgi:hypothetical protein
MQRDSRRHCRVTWEAMRTTLTESSACEFLFSRPPETHSYYFGQGECKRAGICCPCFFFSLDVVMIVECIPCECMCAQTGACARRALSWICCSRDCFFAPSAIISELNGIEKRQGKMRFCRSRVSDLRKCVFTVLRTQHKHKNGAPRFPRALFDIYKN